MWGWFLRFLGFVGDFKEGVWYDSRSGNDNLLPLKSFAVVFWFKWVFKRFFEKVGIRVKILIISLFKGVL